MGVVDASVDNNRNIIISNNNIQICNNRNIKIRFFLQRIVGFGAFANWSDCEAGIGS